MNFTELKKTMKSILCPPGNGVYTVHAGGSSIKNFQEKIYGENIYKTWENYFDKIPLFDGPFILGICSDNGGGILRGASWGPIFIRESLANTIRIPNFYFDLGDIKIIPHLLRDDELNIETIKKCQKALYPDIDLTNSSYPVAPLTLTEFFLDNFYKIFPFKPIFCLGGDHSISYATIKSFLNAKKRQNKRIGIVHFDAHTDLLTERLGIEICFGSWASHIIKELDSPSSFVQLGIRSSGKDKKHWEDKYKIKQYWNYDFKQIGAQKISLQIIEEFKKQNIDEIYVTLDIDVFDSSFVSATGTPEPNGLAPHEVMIVLNELVEHFKISGADLVEVAPHTKGVLNSNNIEPESTLMIAQSFSEFLLGALKKSTFN